MIAALSMIVIQNRNRRTNTRRTFQIAEILEDGSYNLISRYDFKKDKLVKVNDPAMFYKTLELFSGLSKTEVDTEIKNKVKILKYLTEHKITDNEKIALLISYYYINKDYLMKKLFGDKNK